MSAYDELWTRDWAATHSVGPLNKTRQRLIIRELAAAGITCGKLVDLGCGNGACLRAIQAAFPELETWGVDLSETAIANAPSELRPRLRVCRIEDLAAELGAFDAVVCSEVLEHVAEPSHIVGAAVRSLRPGGTAVFTVPGNKWLWSWKDEHDGHVRRFSYWELAEILRAHDLQIDRLTGWGGPFGLLYDRASVLLGPKRLYKTADSAGGRYMARAVEKLLHLDDVFDTPFGFQLVARVHKR